MTKDTNLTWCDTETTGLIPRRGMLLEVAVLITTKDLDPVAGMTLAIKPQHTQTTANLVGGKAGDDMTRGQLCDLMATEVRTMHERSGLIDECMASTVTIPRAAGIIIELISTHTDPEKKAPLCGNTIGFDKAWLLEHMPWVLDSLHYRTIDVSTIKELVRRFQLPQWPAPQDKAHRALADLNVSLQEARFYFQHVFRAAGMWHGMLDLSIDEPMAREYISRLEDTVSQPKPTLDISKATGAQLDALASLTGEVRTTCPGDGGR